MTTLVRSATLSYFIEVASQCGLDARRLVATVGLPVRCLDDFDLMVPAHSVVRLLELAAARAHEPAFGLRMAESRRLSSLGPLGLLVRDEPTLQSALEALVRHIHLHNEAMVVQVERTAGVVLIREEMIVEGSPPMRQAIEMAVGTTFRVLSIFMGAGWRPRRVCFAHERPASTAVHRRVFGDIVEFGQEFNGIVCDAADLDVPNPGADPVMVRYTRRMLEHATHRAASMTARVNQLIVLLLPRGHCRVEVVAQHLGVDRRTVAKHLAAEGTSFSALVDSFRRDLLSRYLDDGSRPLGEVSALLGFSQPSTFSRWHRHRFGVAARRRKTKPVGSAVTRQPLRR